MDEKGKTTNKNQTKIISHWKLLDDIGLFVSFRFQFYLSSSFDSVVFKM